jgi:hypothetical protein
MPHRIVTGGSDPSVDGTLIAWHIPRQPGVLVRDGRWTRVPGTHPALGANRLALYNGTAIQIRETSGPRFAAAVPAPGADAIAVSSEWVAWRAHGANGDEIFVAPLPGAAGGARAPQRIAASKELGRPALEGDRLAYHVPSRTGSRIVIADVRTGKRTTVRRERRALLLNPSLHGGRLLYVRNMYKRQELRVGPQGKHKTTKDRRLWSMPPTGRRDSGHDPGKEHHRHGWPRRLWPRPKAGLSATLWTTALAADNAYVTLLRQVAGRPLEVAILRVER